MMGFLRAPRRPVKEVADCRSATYFLPQAQGESIEARSANSSERSPLANRSTSQTTIGEGLEAWFRNPHAPMPPRWKMALLTWIAVWPVSILVPAILMPLLGPNSPQVLTAGLIAAGIVVILTWVAMPLLIKVAHPWLHP
jgi:antibiotic biosynthesis monooxygenase (ABM) superfamily enzyme